MPKLTAVSDDLCRERPFRHRRRFDQEATTGPDRLLIGGGPHPVRTLELLVRCLPEPVWALAVLHTSPVGHEGRYESETMTHADVHDLLAEFGPLFADDARASIWISEVDGGGRVVLDDLDHIYAYGELRRFRETLQRAGYRRGRPRLPSNLGRHFNEEFDELEERLVALSWAEITPLQEDDVH